MYSAWFGHIRILQMLVNAGATVTHENSVLRSTAVLFIPGTRTGKLENLVTVNPIHLQAIHFSEVSVSLLIQMTAYCAMSDTSIITCLIINRGDLLKDKVSYLQVMTTADGIIAVINRTNVFLGFILDMDRLGCDMQTENFLNLV